MSEFLSSYFRGLQTAAQIKGKMNAQQTAELKQVVDEMHQAQALSDAKKMKDAEIKLNALRMGVDYGGHLLNAGYSSEIAASGANDLLTGAGFGSAFPVPTPTNEGVPTSVPESATPPPPTNTPPPIDYPGLDAVLKENAPFPADNEPLTGNLNILARNMEAGGFATGVPGGKFRNRQDFINKINEARIARGMKPQETGMPTVEKKAPLTPDELEQQEFEKRSKTAEDAYNQAKLDYDTVSDPNNPYMLTKSPNERIKIKKEAREALKVAQDYWDHVNDKHFQYTQTTAARKQREEEAKRSDQTRRDIAEMNDRTRRDIASIMDGVRQQTALSSQLSQLLTAWMAVTNHQTQSSFKYQTEVNKTIQKQQDLEAFAGAVAAVIAPGGEPQSIATFDQETAKAGYKLGIHIVAGQDYNMADLNKYIVKPLEKRRAELAAKLDELGRVYNSAVDNGNIAFDNYMRILNGKQNITPVPGDSNPNPRPKPKAKKKKSGGLPPGFHY